MPSYSCTKSKREDAEDRMFMKWDVLQSYTNYYNWCEIPDDMPSSELKDIRDCNVEYLKVDRCIKREDDGPLFGNEFQRLWLCRPEHLHFMRCAAKRDKHHMKKVLAWEAKKVQKINEEAKEERVLTLLQRFNNLVDFHSSEATENQKPSIERSLYALRARIDNMRQN